MDSSVIAVDRVTAEDRLMLFSDESWPQDIGALAVLDGGPLLDAAGRFRIEPARDAVRRRLNLLPRFRQVLHEPRRGLGRPLWVDCPDFDIDTHVRAVEVPAPAEEAELLAMVEGLRAHRLDRARPMWEMWFLTGLTGGRVALFIRWHHVIADGVAGVAALGALLDTTAAAPAPPAADWTPTPPPADRDLLRDNVRRHADQWRHRMSAVTHPVVTAHRLRAAWPAMRDLLTATPGPRTSLNRLVGPHRSLSLLRTDLELVSDVAHAHGATVNDVLLAVTAAGLRDVLRHRGEPIRDVTLPIYVPVSLRRDRTRPGTGNLISQMVVRLPIDAGDPGERLRRIASDTARLKATSRPSLGSIFRSRLLARILLPVIAGKRVNIETADLPGPPLPLFFCGARVLEVFPLLNLIGNVSLGVGALSYAGRFTVMAVGDGDTYPDLDVFTTGAMKELQVLTGRVSAGVTTG